jgi:DNA (cytosine-5)-methyltransferase 1
MLILSLFPGIDLFGRGFECDRFTIVRGPDVIFGGTIETFRPPAGRFEGIIAGPPCQDFSRARRALPPTGEGVKMLRETARVIAAARPLWWIVENVPGVPDIVVDGYPKPQRLDVNFAWYGFANRPRVFQFGSIDGRKLNIPKGDKPKESIPTVTANDSRSFDELKRLQGLPFDFALPGFTVAAAKRAIGNGVPVPLAAMIARAVRRAYGESIDEPFFALPPVSERLCACGCGRAVFGRFAYDSSACRQRSLRRRRRRRDATA